MDGSDSADHVNERTVIAGLDQKVNVVLLVGINNATDTAVNMHAHVRNQVCEESYANSRENYSHSKTGSVLTGTNQASSRQLLFHYASLRASSQEGEGDVIKFESRYLLKTYCKVVLIVLYPCSPLYLLFTF